jgi:DNA-binding NarL/FixJ family response regulator
MSQLPNSANENVGNGIPRSGQPEVVLLGSKQWSYVQQKYNLTPRERQIAERVCQGLRNGDIAADLRITAGTTKTHIRNIYRKTGVKSKIAMLLKFVVDAEVIVFQQRITPPIPITGIGEQTNITASFSNTPEKKL